MEETVFNTLKQYGLIGIVLFFCGWMIWIQFLNSIRRDEKKDVQINKKDDQIVEMGKQFAMALVANTQATQELKMAMIQLTSSTKRIADKFEWFDRMAKKNEREHEEILDHIKTARAGR